MLKKLLKFIRRILRIEEEFDWAEIPSVNDVMSVLESFNTSYLGAVLKFEVAGQRMVIHTVHISTGEKITLYVPLHQIQTLNHIRAALLCFLDHELREILKLNNAPLYNPHPTTLTFETVLNDTRNNIGIRKVL